jgi:hypothetical protein
MFLQNTGQSYAHIHHIISQKMAILIYHSSLTQKEQNKYWMNTKSLIQQLHYKYAAWQPIRPPVIQSQNNLATSPPYKWCKRMQNPSVKNVSQNTLHYIKNNPFVHKWNIITLTLSLEHWNDTDRCLVHHHHNHHIVIINVRNNKHIWHTDKLGLTIQSSIIKDRG